jgi:hypothetical protein
MGRPTVSETVCTGSERMAVWVVAEEFGVVDVTSKKNE